jgi:hypothetical protein
MEQIRHNMLLSAVFVLVAALSLKVLEGLTNYPVHQQKCWYTPSGTTSHIHHARHLDLPFSKKNYIFQIDYEDYHQYTTLIFIQTK